VITRLRCVGGGKSSDDSQALSSDGRESSVV
jgi:hypothetical protein